MRVDFRALALDGDEESDNVLGHRQAKFVQSQVRSARYMSVGSVVLAMASVAMMGRVALHTGADVSTTSTLNGIVRLSESREEWLPQQPGWYRSYLEGAVRSDMRPDSEEIQVLPVGTLVYVTQVIGRDAQILTPVSGWMSIETEKGVEILQRDMTYKGDPHNVDLREVMHSRKVRDSNEHLQNSAIQMTEVEKKLLKALKRLHVDMESWKGLGQLGHALGERSHALVEKAPDVAEKLAFKFAKIARKPDDVLAKVQENPHVKKIIHGSKVEALVKPALQEISSVQAEVAGTDKSMKEFQASVGELTEKAQLGN